MYTYSHEHCCCCPQCYCTCISMQSFATDEAFATGEAKQVFSPRRLRSIRTDSESGPPGVRRQLSLQRQVSLQRQSSVTSGTTGSRPELKKQVSEKKQEQWDKEIAEVPLMRIIRYCVVCVSLVPRLSVRFTLESLVRFLI